MSEKKDRMSSKIIKMYKQGYCCKDICTICEVSVLKVRNCLIDAGFNTRSYRKISESNKEKIILLVQNGYSHNKIEGLLHTSTHLVREVVEDVGLVGFAPKYHPPIQLEVQETDVSIAAVKNLQELYSSGEFGLAKCADKAKVTQEEFLWFVYHLTNEDKQKHAKQMKLNVKKLLKAGMPVTAIAKRMDVSPSIIKKMLV